jgi:ABC-type multidrug transport system fused ATPase/permease subunit
MTAASDRSRPIRTVLAAARESLTRREKARVAGVGATALLGVALEMLSLGSFIPVVGLLTQESALDEVRDRMAVASSWTDVQILAAGLVGLVLLFVVKNAVTFASGWYQRSVSADLSTRLAHEQFEAYLRQPYSFHTATNSSVLIRNMQNSSVVVTSGVDPLMSIATEGLVAIGVVVLLLVVDPLVTGAVLATFGLAAWIFNRTTRRRIVVLGHLRNVHLGHALREQQQGLGGIKEIHISGRTETFVERHRRHVAANNRINRTYGTIQQLPRLWLEVLTVTGLSALVLLVVSQGREPSEALPILGLFAIAVFRVQPSITRLLISMQSLAFAAPVIEGLRRGTLPVPQPPPVGGTVRFERSVRFEAVTFAYPGSAEPVLDAASFEIARNERIGLVGPSGAGKSTIVDLLLGLLDPTNGKILVDDVDLADVRRSWQDQVGYVPQHIFLLDDSVRRNVAFGVPDAEISDAAVHEALQRAQLDEFVGSLSDGLDTEVGERGVRFSGGQQQRLGIARALYPRPPVLVFDEATSALDATTERGVAAAIEEVGRSRTVVIVAHRTSTLAACDRILRVQDGSVVDLGRPTQELLASLARGAIEGSV